MPTYQYRCTECGVELERVQKFSDPALTHCEDCGGALRKVYNAVGIVFKGSGFYATDNRTKGSASTAAPASAPSSDASSTTSTTTSSTGGDAKPASTSGTSSTSGTATPAS